MPRGHQLQKTITARIARPVSGRLVPGRLVTGRPITAMAATVAALLLSSCASAPLVKTARNPEADFQQYASFTFRTPLGTDRDDGTETLLSQALKRRARDELTALGYRYVDSGADLRVNFFLESREVIEDRPGSGVSVGYGVYHRNIGVWSGYGRDIRQVTEGTLHMDLVDTTGNQLAWEGLAEARIAPDELDFDPADLETAVTRMFQGFPPAGGPAD